MIALRSLLVSAVVLAVTAGSAAAGTTVVSDEHAGEVTVLDGTVVWTTGAEGEPQRLMQRDAAGTRSVRGAPAARAYRSIDLGRDGRGRVVLTYLRCETWTRCVARQDDLRGGRTGLRGLTPRGCSLTTAPARWRAFTAFGRLCRHGRTLDRSRSGLFVRRAGGAPRRLALPRDAVRAGADQITSVDLRGLQVAAVAADIASYAFAQTVRGTGMRSMHVASNEGETAQGTPGLALGAGGDLWSLTVSEHAGDPLETVLLRLAGRCREHELLTAAPDDRRHPATDLAVDHRTLLLVVPGTGIVEHRFTPAHPCS